MTGTARTLSIIAACAAVVGIAFAIGHWTGHRHASHDAEATHREHDHSAKAQAAEETEQWYTCSMHPQVRLTDPNAKCPICGMDLIPVANDGDEDDPALPRLSLSPRAKALMQVQTWPVERREVMREVRLYGRVDFDQQRIRRIAAWVDGRLDELYVDYCCAEVEAGEPMFLMYSPTLIVAQEELFQALRAQRELSAGTAEALRRTTEARATAARDRLRLLGLTANQIEQIESKGTVQDRLAINAPVSGTVIEWDVREGMYVRTGDPLYTVVDLSRVWISLEAYENDLPWVREGQEATFTVAALPGEEFTGRVSFIDRELENGRRTVRVRVEVPNEDRRLKPGMFVSGVVRARASEAGTMLASAQVNGEQAHAAHEAALPLVIPASAPLITGKRAVVYVQDPDPELERPTFDGRQVVLGPRAGDWYIVREGLSEGEMVVTHGNFKIDSELQIRGRPSMMAPEGGGAPMHDHGHGDHGAAAPARATSTHPDVAAKAQARFEAPQAFRKQVGEVVRANFALVEGLSDDDLDKSRAAAKQARAAVDAVEVSAVEGAARDAWRVSAGRMKAALDEVGRVEDLAAMRRQFEPFSDELTRVVRAYGVGEVGPVYRAMCPMVENRRGYWLQPDRPITNPYWGEAMYACGEIAETIVE